jgi:hypothetical protein
MPTEEDVVDRAEYCLAVGMFLRASLDSSRSAAQLASRSTASDGDDPATLVLPLTRTKYAAERAQDSCGFPGTLTQEIAGATVAWNLRHDPGEVDLILHEVDRKLLNYEKVTFNSGPKLDR